MPSIYVALVLLLTLCCFTQPAFAEKWLGPTDGPIKQTKKSIVFLSHDLQNSGPTLVYRGLEKAARILDWKITIVNGKGDTKNINDAFMEIIKRKPDAIVLGAFQEDMVARLIPLAKQANIVLVGWHAAAIPGPTPNLFVNVATNPIDVAKMIAEYVIHDSKEKAGVIIITDNHYAVAKEKAIRIKASIEACKTCKVLSIEDVSISLTDKLIDDFVIRMNQIHGSAWTYTLAINDLYFDVMNIPLIKIGRPDIRNVSAGDGSSTAISRIKAGKSQQIATIAEPLFLQGWQLADELNRAFAGKPPSGFVSKPILVTKQVLNRLNGKEIESDIPYKEAYTAIWKNGVAK
ncbi:substrate-binding domain-containing protein [Chitinimonas sp. BJB300]|uniref:substrate-binding domain-containing protein n=1 Tax=Chitinimonas sp. BJB300 TaxID=1559339 RepID=UPI000C111889|nr:substrate-binding domain-containing protein [Chitinimonas sp. BJB300]PHV13297.1 hypothetical protein CSQ89_01265 [Chitinimonas sp. BJB300]TSJ85998.1 substrate-binding domain-containing protein [Chitinimonas sp. BJB300]